MQQDTEQDTEQYPHDIISSKCHIRLPVEDSLTLYSPTFCSVDEFGSKECASILKNYSVLEVQSSLPTSPIIDTENDIDIHINKSENIMQDDLVPEKSDSIYSDTQAEEQENKLTSLTRKSQAYTNIFDAEGLHLHFYTIYLIFSTLYYFFCSSFLNNLCYNIFFFS